MNTSAHKIIPFVILIAVMALLGRSDGRETPESKAAVQPPAPEAVRGAGNGDWPMYNCDVLGWRHNAAEKTLSPANVGRLEEQWRFPPKGADFQIGVIHATPAIVDGYVYFGTANKATFYKLTPDGKVKWSFRLTERDDRVLDLFGNGVYSSALVTGDAVYFATLAGFVYALDRDSGKEKWRLDMRAKTFPGAHPLNGTFASPILADGKIVVAGGALEQGIRFFVPKYEGFTGRGFVMALEPQSGRIAWKYDVGPKPERLDPPITIKDAWGEHVFQYGPATSTVWSTPSYHAASRTIFFGTDTNNAPRRPTKDDPRLDTRHACAVIALDAGDGAEKWVTQINRGDVWIGSMRGYDPKAGRYLDLSIGDTPRIFTIMWNGTPTLVIGFGCKNGGFYIVRVSDGMILAHTPLYNGPPTEPLNPPPDKRTLALPSPIGGLQTGCATDGRRVYTNGIDAIHLGTQESAAKSSPPTAGRVVAISLDTKTEHWRHERPKMASVGGPPPKRVFKNAGDPVASGLAVANGVVYFTTLMSSKLVALDTATGQKLREIDLPPVWSGPAVSRGRVYVGTGNIVLPDAAFFGPTSATGALLSFGLPAEKDVSGLGGGQELRKVTVEDGVELHYVERGKGSAVVFIHGTLGDCSAWDGQLAPFADSYRAIAYSRRYNYPNTNKPRADHSAVVEAEDLAALIKKLDLGKVHLVGHSYGGYTALFLAVKHPELVRTLTLAEPPVVFAGERLDDAKERLLKRARAAFAKGDPEDAIRIIVNSGREGAYDKIPAPFRQRLQRNAAELEALVTSANMYPALDRDDVRKIAAPTLLLSGEKSALSHKSIDDELERLLPEKGRRRAVIPAADHGMWFQQPEACRRAVLEFLKDK